MEAMTETDTKPGILPTRTEEYSRDRIASAAECNSYGVAHSISYVNLFIMEIRFIESADKLQLSFAELQIGNFFTYGTILCEWT